MLFLLVTVISLFIPSDIRISKATNIATDDTLAFSNIKKLANWKNWHPALKGIPGNEIRLLNDSGIKVKGTTIVITGKKNDEFVTKMVANEGQPVVSGFRTISHQQGDSATLQWYMDFTLRWYPWEKFRSLFYENIYGVQMEQGLANLKELSKAGHP